jgi:hypothetical protein
MKSGFVEKVVGGECQAETQYLRRNQEIRTGSQNELKNKEKIFYKKLPSSSYSKKRLQGTSKEEINSMKLKPRAK